MPSESIPPESIPPESIPRRLLFLTERYPPDIGGVARSAERIARSIAGLGVETHVLAWTKTLPPGRLECLGPVPGRSAQPVPGRSAPPDSGSARPPGSAGSSPRPPIVHRLGLFANWDTSLQHTMNVVEWLHAQVSLQAVWGHYLYPSGFLAVLLAESLGLRSLVSARGNDVDRLMFPPGDFARLLWTVQRAGTVTAVSADLARKLSVLVGGQRTVEVLANSVDSQLFTPGPAEAPLRESLGIRPRETVLGFCGELRHKKGLPFLLAALDQVSRTRPACLLVIGDVRAREASVLSDFTAAGGAGAGRVLVTGPLDAPAEVARHLRLCDLVLQPSVWDGLPNALLEAMACERLVVASDAGGMPDVVEPGENGFLVPRAQLHRLGEAVVEVLGLPEPRRRAVQQAARRTVAEWFHPGRESRRLAELLAGVRPSTSS